MVPRIFPTTADWLTSLLRRWVRKGYTPNVFLAEDGTLPSIGLGDGECVVALVQTTDGRELLLTGERLVEGGRTLLRYGEIAQCHHITDRLGRGEKALLKQTHFDRLILDLGDGRKVALKQLGQAIFPLLRFFESVITAVGPSGPTRLYDCDFGLSPVLEPMDPPQPE